MPRPFVSKLGRAAKASARWLVPSLVAASAATAAAGIVEALGMDSVFGAIATAGFLALVALPAYAAVSAITRGLWAAWQPFDVIEDGGGAPRLAGWLGMFVLGAAGLGWAMFQGTWLLASWTAFKPLSLSFAEPMLALVAVGVLVVASRPVARGLAAIARVIDRRWRARGHGSPFTPVKLLAALAVVIVGGVVLVWELVLKRRIGPLDISVLLPIVVGFVVIALVHAAWRRATARSRRIGGGVAGAIAAVLVAGALFAWQARPSLTLQIWGDRPLAGLAIDKLFDLDAIRAGVSLAEFRPSEQPGAAHPDIILVTIDTVRADHTPPYNGTAEMPVLKELATRGVVFDWAFSPSNVTRRSIPSMIIGLGPDRVRGRVVGWALRVDPRHVLVAERLEAGGYETAGFMCCEGFWGKEMRTGLQRGLQHLEIEPNGLALARQARAWLDAREQRPHDKPLFLWMHILEPHNWTAASGEPHNADERRQFYDHSLTASDGMLGELLGAFSSRRPDQAPIVIVTADHGEALGDHGQPFHSTDLYNSQTHVPFVIAGPGIHPRRVYETISLTDLTPTLLELAGFQVPIGPEIDGHSFADLATGKRTTNDPDSGVAYSAMIKDRSNPGGVSAIIKGRWKLIDTPVGFELYDCKADPGERSNLIAAHPPAFDVLKKLMLAHRAAAERSPFE